MIFYVANTHCGMKINKKVGNYYYNWEQFSPTLEDTRNEKKTFFTFEDRRLYVYERSIFQLL